jgi:hypothetical protein
VSLFRTLAFLIAVTLSMAASAQFSQGTRDRDPDLEGSKKLAADIQEANFHWGAVYLLSQVRIADIGYTDQGYIPSDDQGGHLTLGVEAPQRLYFVPARKVILSAELVPGISYTQGIDPQTQFNYRARGDAHFLFNHLYLDVYGSRTNSVRAQVADVNRLATVLEDETGVAGEIKYSSRTSALFSVRFRDLSFPSDRLQPRNSALPLIERSERLGRLSLLHKTFPVTSLTFAAETGEYDFDRATYKNGRRTWFGPGIAFNNGRVEARAEAGPGRLRFDDPTQHNFDGALGRASLTFRRPRWELAASAHRDVGFTVMAFNNYYVADQGGATISYAVRRRLTLRAYTMLEHDDYPVEVFGNHRKDDISFSAVGFDYRMRRLGVGMDVGYYERTSTFGGDEDSGIRYVLHLSYTP